MNLATKEEYKLYVGSNPDNPKDDETISALIAGCSNTIKEYCNRTFIDFYSIAKEELFLLKPYQTKIFLNETPLKEVTITNIEEPTYLFDSFINKDTGIISIDVSNKQRKIEVVYTGGFPETPPDIKIALFELINHYKNDRHLPQRNMGGATVQNFVTQPEFWPSHIARLLDFHRNA